MIVGSGACKLVREHCLRRPCLQSERALEQSGAEREQALRRDNSDEDLAPRDGRPARRACCHASARAHVRRRRLASRPSRAAIAARPEHLRAIRAGGGDRAEPAWPRVRSVATRQARELPVFSRCAHLGIARSQPGGGAMRRRERSRSKTTWSHAVSRCGAQRKRTPAGCSTVSNADLGLLAAAPIARRTASSGTNSPVGPRHGAHRGPDGIMT